jgi:hypothetical protein
MLRTDFYVCRGERSRLDIPFPHAQSISLLLA